MPSRFRWTTFDLNECLPADWQQDIREVAANADFHEFPRTPILSREAVEVQRIPRGRVHAAQVRDRLPWLYRAYREDFLDMAAELGASVVLDKPCDPDKLLGTVGRLLSTPSPFVDMTDVG